MAEIKLKISLSNDTKNDLIITEIKEFSDSIFIRDLDRLN
jgi:hypothetical protein